MLDQHAIELRRFETPDQRLDMKERGGISIVEMADGSSGMHAIFDQAGPGRRMRSRCSARPNLARCGTPATAFRARSWSA